MERPTDTLAPAVEPGDSRTAARPEELYEEHRKGIEADYGAQLPPWSRLPEWERGNWAEYADELNADG